MVRSILRKELTEMIREKRLRVAGLIVISLTVLATIISYGYYKSIQQQHEKARQSTRNVWVSQDEKSPHSAAHFGTYAFKPKQPLSLIDQGVDKYAGISIFLEAHRRNEAEFAAAADQTGLSRFGELTPDFILLFIIPLLIVLLGYNTFTRESEQGTMRLLRSQGVPSWKVTLGKWLSVFLPIAAITVLLFALGAVLLSTLSDFGVFRPGNLLLLLATYLLFYAVFTNITLLVSAFAKKSGISLVLSLAIWILACLAVPKGATNLADRLHPYPSQQAFAQAIAKDKAEGLDGHNPWSKEARELEQAVLDEYGVDSVQQLPFNFDAYRMQKGEEHEAEVYFKHYALLKDTYQKQSQVYRSTALLSPFLPARFLSMAIARTDYQTHWDFANAAERYRIKMMEALNMDMAENSKTGDWAYAADTELWSEIPEFSYEPTDMPTILQRNLTNIFILFGWLLATGAGLAFITRKS